VSFGDALLRRQRAGQTQRGRADVGADGARFDTERKATQARAIDLAVQEIQRQIADRKEAIRAFNEALAPSEAQLAEKGVAEKACEAMGKRWNPETQHCEPAPEPPKEIPGELVTGWAAFVARWRDSLRSFQSFPEFVGSDVDRLLADYSREIGEWQKRFSPYVKLSAEVPHYEPDTSGWPGWAIGVTVAVPVLGAAIAAAYIKLKGKLHDYAEGQNGKPREG